MPSLSELKMPVFMVIILVCIFISPVAAGEVQNPGQDSGPQDLPVNPVAGHATGHFPQLKDMSYLSGPFVVDDAGLPSPADISLKTAGALPSRFDLRELGRVTPVKDQGAHGACWVFGSMASLESGLLPNETWSFSENNMKNLLSNLYPEGFDQNFSTGGGTNRMATAYFARWTGPINQSDDPYNQTSPYSPTDKKVQKHVQNVVYIPDRKNATDNYNIKAAVYAFGAVDTSYNVTDENVAYWNESTSSYYYFGPVNDSNHEVAIAGWDDGWSRYNFSTVPPGDGAFIVKNSWGATNYGDKGYFYCSYYDKLIGKDNALFFAEPPTNYNHIYQYDPLGWVDETYEGSEKTGWAANVFNSTRNETLSAVSFYTTDTATVFNISVYRNPNNGPVLNSSGAAWMMNGTFGNSGYHTVPLPGGVPLNANDNFSVAVKFINPSYAFSISLQNRTSKTSKAKAFPGQGYVSEDGTAWTDLTTQAGHKDASICIKAFTRDLPGAPELVGMILDAPKSVKKNTDNSLHFSTMFAIRNSGSAGVTKQFREQFKFAGKAFNMTIPDDIPANEILTMDVQMNFIPDLETTTINNSQGPTKFYTITTGGNISVGDQELDLGTDIDNDIDELDETNNYVDTTISVISSDSPVANFTANVTSGTTPLTVQFTDTSTGLPTAWNWSFGDGVLLNATVQHPVHTYILAGNHTVTLMASSADGANTMVKDKYIVIYPKGDFNHNWKVDIGDVSLVAYVVVGREAQILPDADFNGNGIVDIGDAAKIAYYLVRKIPDL